MLKERSSNKNCKNTWFNRIFPGTLAVASIISLLSCNNPRTWDANHKKHAQIEQMDTTNEKKLTPKWYSESNTNEVDVFNWWEGTDALTEKDPPKKNNTDEADVFNWWEGTDALTEKDPPTISEHN